MALPAPELGRYLSALRRRFLIVLLCPLAAGVAAGAVSYQLPPVYEAKVSLLVRPVQPLSSDTNTVALSSDQITATYAALMTERPLLQRVAADLNLNSAPEELGSHIRVTRRPGTTIIDVTVDDTNAGQAATVGNTLVTEFISSEKQIQRQEIQSPNSLTADNFVVVSPAVPPTAPISPKKAQNILVAIGAGLLLAMGLVFLLEYLDQTIKDDHAVTERTGLFPLSHIPFASGKSAQMGELVSLDRQSPAAEAYRRLRTNLLFSSLDREVKALLVTSSEAGEGKSRTAANLAVVLATAGHPTLLLDCDFRRPSVHRIFKVMGDYGLSNLVLAPGGETEQLRPVENVGNLWVLPAGHIPPNPSELLGSGRMKALLDRFRQHFRYIVIDAPPVNPVTDAVILATSVDGVVMIVEHGRTTFSALLHSKQSIDMVGGRVLGVVVNKIRPRGGYHSYYGYGPAAAPAPARVDAPRTS